MATQHLITKNSSVFGKLKDYFFITKFQTRINEHEHGLLWIQNVPIYQKYSDEETVKFVDRYISSYSSYLGEDLE